MSIQQKKSFREWAQEVKLWYSLLKIFLGILIGIATTIPSMWAIVNNAVQEAVTENDFIDFLWTKYKIDCIIEDIQNYPDDLRVMDLSFVLDLWEATADQYKTKSLEMKIMRIEEFYKQITGG